MYNTKFHLELTIRDHMDNYREEDIVKNLWPSFYGFLTRRHGMDEGYMSLNDGAIEISWRYVDLYTVEEDDIDQ